MLTCYQNQQHKDTNNHMNFHLLFAVNSFSSLFASPRSLMSFHIGKETSQFTASICPADGTECFKHFDNPSVALRSPQETACDFLLVKSKHRSV